MHVLHFKTCCLHQLHGINAWLEQRRSHVGSMIVFIFVFILLPYFGRSFPEAEYTAMSGDEIDVTVEIEIEGMACRMLARAAQIEGQLLNRLRSIEQVLIVRVLNTGSDYVASYHGIDGSDNGSTTILRPGSVFNDLAKIAGWHSATFFTDNVEEIDSWVTISGRLASG